MTANLKLKKEFKNQLEDEIFEDEGFGDEDIEDEGLEDEGVGDKDIGEEEKIPEGEETSEE